MGSVLDFEDKKILFETIKKILYGKEFDELPPAKILRSIVNIPGFVSTESGVRKPVFR